MFNNVEIRFKEIQKYLFGERGIIIAIAIFFGCCIYLYIVEFYTTDFSISKYLNLSKATINFHSGTKNSGIYYSIGEAFQQTNPNIKNIPSSGGYENALSVLSDSCENSFGLVQEEAYLKDNVIRKYLNYVVPLYLERMHVFCNTDSLKLSSYNSPEQLRAFSETKINIGPIGSGTNILSGYVIDELNKQIELYNSSLPKNDPNKINFIGDLLSNYSFNNAFKDSVPIIMTIAGAPFKSAIDVLNSKRYKLVSIDPLFVDKINQERNLGLRSVTFQGKYEGGKRINTFATTTFLITRKSTNPAIIKKVLNVFNDEIFKRTFYNDVGLIFINDSVVHFPDCFIINDLNSSNFIPNKTSRYFSVNFKNTFPFKIEHLSKDSLKNKIYCYPLKDTIKLNEINKLIEVEPHFEDIHFTEIFAKQFQTESNLIIRNLGLFFISLISISFGMFVLITNFLSAIKYHKYFNEITNIVRINVPDNAILDKDSIVRMTNIELSEFDSDEKDFLAFRLNASLYERHDDENENLNKLDFKYKDMFIRFIDNIKTVNLDEQSGEIIKLNRNNNLLANTYKILSLILIICLIIFVIIFITRIEFFPNLLLFLSITVTAGVLFYFIINKRKKTTMNKKFNLYKDALTKEIIRKTNCDQISGTGELKHPYLKKDQYKLINRINNGISKILLIRMDIAQDYSDGGLKEKDYNFLMKNCNAVLLMLKKSLAVRLLHCCKKNKTKKMNNCLNIFQTAEYLDIEDYENIIKNAESLSNDTIDSNK